MVHPANYFVQVADSFGFDFGGENGGGIAWFVHAEDAYQFAKGISTGTGKAVREMLKRRKGATQEFYFNAKEVSHA